MFNLELSTVTSTSSAPPSSTRSLVFTNVQGGFHSPGSGHISTIKTDGSNHTSLEAIEHPACAAVQPSPGKH
jgi:hypothetical protein